MSPRISLLPRLCALALLVVALAPPARAASDWQVIKVGGWDYLSVDNIAKFYGFPPTLDPVNKTIRLDSGRNQLEVTLDSREAIINGVRNWLCFPVIAHSDGKYLISRIDLAKTLEPQFRPQMIGTLRPLKTVVIDPGHGGIEKGAASSYGNEKDFALDVAKQLKPMVEAQGLRVIMTRESDVQVPLPARAKIANATRDSIFVSIHFNATDYNPQATGFEIYSLTPRGAPSTQDNSMMSKFASMQAGTPVDAASLALSFSVYHSMLGHMPEFDRGIKRARFAVLRLTQIPAILVEGGFLSQREESKSIANKEWRGKLAKAINVGIQNYRTLVEKKQRPMLLADYRRQFEGVLVARDASKLQPSTSSVLPASNLQSSGALARLTAALRREPSAQYSVSEKAGDDEGHASIGPADPTPTPAVAADSDAALLNPAAAPQSEELAAAAVDSSSMPPPTDVVATEDAPPVPQSPAPAADAPSETQSPPEPERASASAPADAPSLQQSIEVSPPLGESAPMSATPLASPTPAATPSRWERLMKLLPPPKFRQ